MQLVHSRISAPPAPYPSTAFDHDTVNLLLYSRVLPDRAQLEDEKNLRL